VTSDKNFRSQNISLTFFVRKTLSIPQPVTSGRKKDGATRPRPIVVKFGSYVEREMVRNLSKPLKGTNFGISPHYPPEVLEKRKKVNNTGTVKQCRMSEVTGCGILKVF
jgi:hypothetical protein